MKVDVKQEYGFADCFFEGLESELDGFEEVINWEKVEAGLSEIRTDYSALSMFKMLLLQVWHNISDETVAQMLRRDVVFMKFCGFSVGGSKPDAATLCRFRQKLIERRRLEKLLGILNKSMEEKGLKVSEGKHVSMDATLVQSARRARKVLETVEREEGVYETNEEVKYSDDAEAAWLKRSGKAVYGYAGTFTTDAEGLIESVSVRPANESEMTNFPDILDEAEIAEGTRVLYDKGTDSAANREELKNRGLKDGIMRKKPKGKEMPRWEKVRNKLISARRFVVERTFGTLKRVYGMNRARYIGLRKVCGETLLKSIAYNLKRGLNKRLELKQTAVT